MEWKNVQEEEFLEKVFSLFDIDRSGMIDAHELGSVLRSLGKEATEAEVQDLLAEADVDKNEKISKQEFKDLMKQTFNFEDHNQEDQQYKDSEIKEIYEILDRQSAGIGQEELLHAFSCLGENLTEQDIKEMLIVATGNANGKVTVQQFTDIIKNQFQN